jgi:hypothetical protein
MLNKSYITKYLGLLLGIIITIFSTAVWAQPMHSVMLTVPDYPEEALTWCGPATGQMIMEGYPSGACSYLQEDVWMAIQSYKTETMWDTDPDGLKGAMNALCHPAGRWNVYSDTDPQKIMHSVAKWMTINNYPVAGLLNTVSHNAYTAHTEHWVAIRGIITDKDPTTNPSVTLKFVWFNDPAVPLGDPSIERFVSGSTWYNSEFQPVTKVGSSYHGKYVAVIEPPEIKGKAIATAEVLIGKVITPDDALKYSAKWIEAYKLYEIEPYKLLRKAKPLMPLLVNKHHGGYYIIPYTLEEKSQLAQAAILINAYTGNFQEVGAFKPLTYMAKDEAINIALKYLDVEKPKKVDAELIFPVGEQTVSRYFPIWKVTVDRKVLGVGRQGNIYTKIPSEEFSIPLPGIKPQGIAWDGKHLWAVDEQTKKLYNFDSRSGAVVKSLDINLKKPKGLAFDGRSIWIADEETRNIHAVNPESGQIMKTIKMEIPQEKGFKSFEGITWDGKYLWTAIYAGFSSSFNQIDAESGRIIRSIFADCNPRGIASDGKYIWSICYNGENLPSKIDRRKILEKEHEMLRSRVFIRDIEGRDPTGLVYDGQYLWYSDRALKRAFMIYPGSIEEK